MYETLLRPHEVNTTPRLPTAGEASARLKEAMARREEKRLKQVAASQQKRAAQKRKRGANGGDAEGQGDQQDADSADNAGAEAAKKLRVDENEETNVRLVPAEEGTSGAGKIEERMDLDEEREHEGSPQAVITQTPLPSSQPQPPSQVVISKVTHEVRGHTSYLTFATLEPALGIVSNAETTATIAEPEPSQPPTDQ